MPGNGAAAGAEVDPFGLNELDPEAEAALAASAAAARHSKTAGPRDGSGRCIAAIRALSYQSASNEHTD